MRVTIWDMDWFYDFSHIPNHRVMKISSYHKQQNHYINFVEKERDLKYTFDIMYIIRENTHTPFPSAKYVDKDNIKMIGQEFNFYDNWWSTTAVIDMCRPDYTLYDVGERNAYGNAHVVQFLHKGKLLTKKQYYINSAEKHHKKTLVVDDGLWNLKKETILKIFKELKSLKNIAFLKPISLNIILSDQEITEKFLKLRYSAKTFFNFINDYGDSFQKVKDIIDFIKDFRDRHYVKLKGINVKSVTLDHWKERENGIKDLNRVLKIIDYAKKNKVKIQVEAPYELRDTPHWIFFDILDVWSKYSFRESFIETMLKSTAEKYNIRWYEVINNPAKWSTPRADLLIYLMSNYPQIAIKYGGRKWGNNFTNIKKIDWNAVGKYTDYRLREKTIQNIQNTIANELAGG